MNDLDTSIPQIDLFVLLNGLIKSMKHLWLVGVLLSILFSGVLCVREFINYTPLYQASASFTVWLKNPFYSSQSYYNTSAAEQMAKTFPYILTSGVLKERVEEELGLSYVPSVHASAIGNTNILTLTVTSNDPDLAYDVLLCIMDVYPEVAEFVVGPTSLALINDTGKPMHPSNSLSYTSSVVRGCTAAIVIYLIMSLFYWYTHQTISTEDDLARLLNLRCLGKLPRAKIYSQGSSISCPILNDHNDKFGFNESVRLLRVRVEKEMEKKNAKVLMVTSTIANEGKTTISINLALAMAQKGKKTLLLDCDLRNPSVAATLGMENDIGVSDYLENGISIKSIFKRIQNDNLFVVFGGKPVSNSEKLLSSAKAANFLKAARNSFDYIILDTPPCALLADASEICSLADCSLITVREDFACRDQILEVASLLSETERPILGCVINMSKPKLGHSSYSYYGYYGQYGASSKTEENSTNTD